MRYSTPRPGQIVRQDVGREARLLLVEIHRDQAEVDRRALLHRHQHREHGVGILAAGDADEQRIAVFDHVVISDGSADIAFQALFQALKIL
jgi:ribonuclease BN (tRNA processing enzyme)